MFVVRSGEITTNMLSVDDHVFSTQHDSDRSITKVFLPHNIFLPKETAGQSVSYTDVVGGEILQAMFVGVSGFAVQL
jgi:hypothetical protein